MSADFFDSNIMVYSVDIRSPDKQVMAQNLIGKALETQTGVISFQVVQETLNTLTKKFNRQVSQEQRNAILDAVLMPLWQVQPSRDIYVHANALKERYGYSFYDSLIIAAALAANCTTLYSEDLHDGHTIDGLSIVNPFV